jgi:hypothetical protein
MAAPTPAARAHCDSDRFVVSNRSCANGTDTTKTCSAITSPSATHSGPVGPQLAGEDRAVLGADVEGVEDLREHERGERERLCRRGLGAAARGGE